MVRKLKHDEADDEYGQRLTVNEALRYHKPGKRYYHPDDKQRMRLHVGSKGTIRPHFEREPRE
jgi:hypothetical protein